jgi:hypothetical protein
MKKKSFKQIKDIIYNKLYDFYKKPKVTPKALADRVIIEIQKGIY